MKKHSIPAIKGNAAASSATLRARSRARIAVATEEMEECAGKVTKEEAGDGVSLIEGAISLVDVLRGTAATIPGLGRVCVILARIEENLVMVKSILRAVASQIPA